MKYTKPLNETSEDAPYVNPVPAANQKGSVVPAEAVEHPQREIENAIVKAGLTPEVANLTQLGSAIQKMIDDALLNFEGGGSGGGDYIGKYELTPTPTPRPGFFFLEGQEKNRADYQALYDWAATNNLVVTEAEWQAGKKGMFSSGDNSTTFREPDWRNQFIRIHNGAAGRVLGSNQLDAFKSHTHIQATSDEYNTNVHGETTGHHVRSDSIGGDTNDTHAPFVSATGGEETRPVNISLNMMICYDLELAGSIETSGGTSGEGFPGGASHVAVTASKALALSDANTIQVVSSSSTVVITVPTKASVAFPVTNSIGIIGSGSGEVSIAAASGVTINSKDGNLKLDGQHAGATLIKTADDVWTLITTRAEFERLKNTKPETLTDLERAARFIYLQRTAFGGKVSGQHFGVAAERPARFDVTKLIPMLEDLHERLAGVVIENLSYSDFIERYNKPYVLFYLDPPYWNCENDYGKNIFSKDDFEKLAKQLKNIKGSFILSLNDKKEVREIFKDFYIESVSTNYSVSVGKTKKVGEVLISNVDTANISPHKNAA